MIPQYLNGASITDCWSSISFINNMDVRAISGLSLSFPRSIQQIDNIKLTNLKKDAKVKPVFLGQNVWVKHSGWRFWRQFCWCRHLFPCRLLTVWSPMEGKLGENLKVWVTYLLSRKFSARDALLYKILWNNRHSFGNELAMIAIWWGATFAGEWCSASVWLK